MRIAVPKERRPQERRVAASPDTAKRLIGMGHEVVVEAGAGDGAAFPDAAYTAVGATIAGSQAEALGSADVILKVQRPEPQEVSAMKRGAVLIAMLSPLQYPDEVEAYASAGLTAFAMELVPRITRAQTMDVLSSQANLAGYQGRARSRRRVRPRLSDDDDRRRHDQGGPGPGDGRRRRRAAGDRDGAPARRHRLRHRCAHSPPRSRSRASAPLSSRSTSEAMSDAETAGGYANEMGEDFARRQREQIDRGAASSTDIVICTALIPGRKAPVLLTTDMIGVHDGRARSSSISRSRPAAMSRAAGRARS